METVFITGSNRGIGLALVNAYLARGNVKIFAGVRTPQKAIELQDLAAKHPDAVMIVPIDVNEQATIDGAAGLIANHTDHLDVLVNNAGIFPKGDDTRAFGKLDGEAVAHVITTNAVSSLMVTQAFAGLLKQASHARVVMISSQMGSIQRANAGSYAYRMSKAAMNMAAAQLAKELQSDGITVVTTHPGWVSTDMGGASAPVEPDQSAAGLLAVIDGLTMAQTGHFLNYLGESMPW